eukprot:jgi/Mesen1/3064/ME000018S02374
MPFSLLQRMEDVPSNPSGGSGSPELEEAAVTALTALDTSSPPPSEAEADKLRKGIFKYSCQHYKRRCKLRAPCCGQVFPCRHCHNEAQAGDEKQHHELPRHSVKLVICSLCDTEQEVWHLSPPLRHLAPHRSCAPPGTLPQLGEGACYTPCLWQTSGGGACYFHKSYLSLFLTWHVQQHCRQCGVCMGEYFCSVCNFFDDDAGDEKQHHELPRHSVKLVICSLCDTEQEVWHLSPPLRHLAPHRSCAPPGTLPQLGEGACYTPCLWQTSGGGACYFHKSYLSLFLTWHVQQHCRQCGVCMGEYFCSVCNFFDDDHLFESTRDITVMQCGHTMHLHCFKEMRSHAKFSCPICLKTACDMKRAWALLEQEVGVLCHDCGSISDVPFHILGQKCGGCGSYNTRRVRDFV